MTKMIRMMMLILVTWKIMILVISLLAYPIKVINRNNLDNFDDTSDVKNDNDGGIN